MELNDLPLPLTSRKDRDDTTRKGGTVRPHPCRGVVRGLGAIALVGALTLLGPAPRQSQATPTDQADDAEQLRELAERLLGPPPPWFGTSAPPVQLFVGRLPNTLPP